MDYGDITINTFNDGEIDVQTYVDVTPDDFIRIDTFISKMQVHMDVVNFFPSDDISAQPQIYL